MSTIFSLYSGHFKNSKKMFIFSCIGLIVALTLLSSSLYFIDNSRIELLNNYLNKDEQAGNDIAINMLNTLTTDSSVSRNVKTSIQSITSQYNINFINNTQTEITIGLKNFDTEIFYIFSNSTYQFVPVTVYQITPYLENELQQVHMDNYGNYSPSLINVNTNANSLFQPAFLLYASSNSGLNNQVDLTNVLKKGFFYFYDTLPNAINPPNFYKVNVTDFSEFQILNNTQMPNTNQNSYNSQKNYPYLNSLALSTTNPAIMLFVSNLTQFTNFYRSINFNMALRIKSCYTVHLGFDYSKINLANINEFLNEQRFFIGTIKGDLSDKGFEQIQVNFFTSNSFYYIEGLISNLTTELIVINLPLLIIALFLTHFSFSLIYRNTINVIGVYKTRGASGWMIFSFEIIDIIMIVMVSIFFALIIGAPLSVFSLKSDYLLSFNYPLLNYYLFNVQTITTFLFYFSIIIEILVNANRIKKLSLMPIVETENPIDKDDPSWKKHNLDILLFIYGFGMILLYYFIISDSGLLQLFYPVLTIIILLILPSPFAFVIGSILFLSRIIPIFLNRTGSVLWKYTGNLTAISFKNVIRYKNATIRAVLITSTIIAFLILFYAQPYSMMENFQQTSYYQSGADGVALFKDNVVDQSLVQYLSQNFSSSIESVCPYILLSAVSDLNEKMTFLLVNTTSYVNTAYLNFDLGLQNYIGADFYKLTMNNFNKSAFPTINILLDQQEVIQRQTDIGFSIIVASQSSKLNNFTTQSFKIADSFVNWPFLKANYYTRGYFSTFNAIGDINYFLKYLNNSLANSIFNSILEAGLFIKFKPSANLSNVSALIESKTSLRFKTIPKLDIQNYRSGFSFLSIVGEVNLNVLVSFAVIILILLFYIQFQLIEGKREIFTGKALGMKAHQLVYTFYIENIILVGFSIILGSLVGYFLTYFVSILTLTSFQSYPKNIVFIPFDLVLLTNVLILIISLIISTIPAIMVLKEDISDVFTGGSQ